MLDNTEQAIKNGQSKMDNQEWTIQNGQSRMDNEEWTIKNGQSRMDNPEKLTTLCTHQTKTNKTKNVNKT